MNNILTSSITIAIIVAVVAIGIYFKKRAEASAEGYFVAGRSISVPVSAVAVMATFVSAATIVGLPGVMCKLGFIAAILMCAGAACAFGWNAYVIAPAFRRAGVNSVPEFLASRYGNNMRFVSLLAILLGYVGYLVAQYKAAGLTLESLLGIPYVTGLVVFGAIVAAYIMLGGLFAVIWSDFIQGLMVIAGMVAITVGILIAFGSPGDMFAAAQAAGAKTVLWEKWGNTNLQLGITFFAAYGLMTLPHVMVRFFAVKGAEEAKRVSLWAGFLGVVVWTPFFLIALAALIISPQLKTPDAAIFIVIKQVLTNPLMASIMYSAIIAAVLSTAAGMTFVAATTVSYDLLKIIKPDVDSKQLILWNRVAVCVVTVLIIGLALNPPLLLLELAAAATLFISATIGVPVIFGIWWKKSTQQAAVCSLVVSGSFILLFRLIPPLYKWFMKNVGFWPELAGFAMAVLIMLIVSSITSAKEKEVQFYSKIHTTEKFPA